MRGTDRRTLLHEGAVLETERRLAWLRIVVMGASTILFPLAAERAGVHVWLGYALLVAGWLYALALLWLEPYRKHPVLVSATFTTVTDSSMTLLWVYATGGIHSPWVAALYSLVAYTAFRHDAVHTFLGAVLTGAGYAVLAALHGDLTGHGPEVAVRLFFLVVIAVVGASVTREQNKNLASRVRLLDMTQQMAHVGSWEWSVDDGSLRWSDELFRIFGLPAGSTPSFEAYVAAIAPEDRDRVVAQITAARDEKTPFELDHRILRADGSTRWLHCRGRAVVDVDGRVRELIGTAQDVTERHEIQMQLAFPSKLTSLGTLASGIAHEINSPLGYVANNLELIERELRKTTLDTSSREKLESALGAARHGSERVRDIVRGIRTFSRAEDAPRGAVDVTAVVDSALALMAHEVEGRARIVRDYDGCAKVLASESRLSQVLVNLLVNAAQAIEPGAAHEHGIRVRVRRDGGRVRVDVSDTGRGIRPEHLDRIFDPFFTTKPPGEGTGLGLAICQGILRDLHGELTVESELGRGSTFHVVLPAAERVDHARDASSPPDGERKRKRVLVVDDEPRYARSLQMLLSDLYDVVLTGDGKTARDLVASGVRFDVILCDLTMPGMSGMDLHAELGVVAPDQQARMAFLSGGATNDAARAFLSAPGICHAEKPLAFPALQALIEQIISERTSAAA